MFKPSTLLIATLIATTALTSLSAHAENPWYASVDAGLAVCQGDAGFTGTTGSAGGTPTASLKNGGTFGAAVGYDIQGPLRFELEVRTRALDSDSGNMLGKDDSAAGLLNRSSDVFSLDTSVKSTSLMAVAYYDFQPIKRIQPYLKAGLGQSWNTSDTTLSATINSGINGFPTGFAFNDYKYAKDTRSDFAWTVGAGASYPLTEKLKLDLEYAYNRLGKATSAYDAFGDAIAVKKLASHDITLGLRYSF